MAFKKPEIHTIKPDIKNAYIYLRAVRKWGKTTTWKNIILQKYNGDASRGLLIEVGNEHGTTMLDNINTTHVSTYKDMMELRDWLIKEKGNEHNIEMLCFDVVDELPEIFDKEVIRLNNIENPNKPSKSVKSCFGGYNAGVEMSANMIKKYMESLKQAGFGIICIGHTKMKAVSSRATTEDEKWMTLTGNISSNYESSISDVCDIVLTGNIEREFEVKGEGDNAKNYLVSEERRLYLRGTELIDAGNRMAPGSVPDYIVFDCTPEEFAKKLINTIETGMEASKSSSSAPKKPVKLTSKPVETEPEEDNTPPWNEDDELNVKGRTDDFDESEDLFTEIEDESFDIASALTSIRAAFKTADADTKKSIKSILASNGGKLSEDLPVEILKSIMEILDI